MVESIRPTYPTRPATPSSNKVRESEQVETSFDEKKGDEPYVVNKDRRKKRDRRSDDRGENRGLYDMRGGRDRRRSDGDGPHIEIKV